MDGCCPAGRKIRMVVRSAAFPDTPTDPDHAPHARVGKGRPRPFVTGFSGAFARESAVRNPLMQDLRVVVLIVCLLGLGLFLGLGVCGPSASEAGTVSMVGRYPASKIDEARFQLNASCDRFKANFQTLVHLFEAGQPGG